MVCDKGCRESLLGSRGQDKRRKRALQKGRRKAILAVRRKVMIVLGEVREAEVGDSEAWIQCYRKHWDSTSRKLKEESSDTIHEGNCEEGEEDFWDFLRRQFI